MTFYQELQLDQAGSKKLIQNTEGLKNTAGSSEVRTAL